MHRRLSLLPFAVAAMLACTGCAILEDSGRSDEGGPAIPEEIIEGLSTKAAVLADLGAPMGIVPGDGGAEVWYYDFEMVRPDATTFVPTIDLLSRVSSATPKNLAVLFDHDDVVQRVALIEAEARKRDGSRN